MGSVYADLGAYSEVMTTSSNLRSFLGSVILTVGTHTIAKWSSSSENTNNRVQCYNLEDLWNRFYEWSACGVRTLVRFPSGVKIDQYFVPYLSAIRLYTKANNTSQSSSCHGDCNVACGNMFDDHNYNKFGGKATNNDQPTSPTLKSGQLCFQYFELASHDERIPLADKVYELSLNFPVLASLHSAELSPSSWMSVFWYPICHVPENNLEDLTTCFLTYHGLSTSEALQVRTCSKKNSRKAKILFLIQLHDEHILIDRVPLDTEDALHRYAALTPFGLSTHNMDNAWISPGSGDEELAASLFSTARSWLKENDIKHHDFDNFPNIMNLAGDEDCPKAFAG